MHNIYCRVAFELCLHGGLAATTAQNCLMQSRACANLRKHAVSTVSKSAYGVLFVFMCCLQLSLAKVAALELCLLSI